MMYVVSYDLNKPGKKYSGLYEQLKNSASWWHYLDSTWLIGTNEGPNELYNRLSAHIDKNDSLLIIEVASRGQGWLPQEAWDWIKQNIPGWSNY